MDHYAIIHSFHSQVFPTVAELDAEPDFIFALDAHLDTQMGVKNHLDLIPKDVQLAAIRASAHSMIRRAVGELPILLKAKGLSNNLLPDMILAIPQVSLDTEIFEKMSMIQASLKNTEFAFRSFREAKDFWVKFLKRDWGIKVYLSPPNNLLKFVKKIKKADYVLLDLDVDYLYELQNECYTPLKKAQPNQLGSMQKVLSLISKSKPSIITISEARVRAIKDKKSNFSRLINRLNTFGYEIQNAQIFSDDEEADRLLNIYKEYYEKIQKPLTMKYAPDLYSDAYNKELRKAIRKYFFKHRKT